MNNWDIFKSLVTIASQAPIERIIFKRPYVQESHIAPAVMPSETEPVEETQYAGTSQLSAAGKACLPCGNDHFSTTSGELAEAMRFARAEGTIDHPEVLTRLAHSEDELNVFEREDGAPEKIVKLPPEEKALMNEMLVESRKLRHMLKEINTVDDLERVGAVAQETRRDFRNKLFRLQLARLTPQQQDQVKAKAMSILDKQLELAKEV